MPPSRSLPWAEPGLRVTRADPSPPSTSTEAPVELKFQVYAKIAKPVEEVFDAVYNPKKLSGYFTTGGASAPLDEGTTVTWDFADFPGAFPVQVRKVEHGRLIVLE